MLKMLSTVTRLCLKKICVGFVTCAKKSAEFLSKIAAGAANLLTEGWNWMGTNLRKPLPRGLTKTTEEKSSTIWTTVRATVKAVAIQRLLAFIGGIICVFVLPSDITNGDLTWFENMLTSSKNILRDTVTRSAEKIIGNVCGVFNNKAGEIT